MDKNKNSDQYADLRKQAEDKIQKSENLYRSLFENMLYGYAYCKMIFENDRPQDFTYITVNSAFEKLTGLKNVAGKKVSEVIPGIQESNPELFQIYGRVALAGKTESFETYLESLGIWFSVTAYCPEKEHFVAVFEDVTERKRIENEKKKLENELEERVKELDCLYSIASIVETPNITLEGIFKEIVKVIPSGWQYPDITCTRITIGKEEYVTTNYKDTKWEQTADLIVNGTKDGCIEVFYLEERAEIDEGPFLKQERSLINAIAERLGHVVEREIMEEQLRENQERYRIITDNMRDTVWLMDLNLRTTWISPSVTRTRGFTLEEIQEMPLNKRLTPESLSRIMKTYQENVTPDKLLNLNPEVDVTISGEFEYYRKDGSVFWADTIITLLRGKNGEPTGFMCVGRDITERRQAEEKLRENEERYRNVIAQAGGVAYQRDWQNGTYTFMDDGIKHLTGYSSDEITPELFERLVDEENPDGVNKKFIRSEISQQIGGDTATLYQGEYRIKTKDGQIKYVSDSSIELRNANDELIQTLGMLQDITQNKQAQEALRESEEKLRSIIESSPDAITVTDLNGIIVECNQAAIDQHGSSTKAELIGKNSFDLIAPKDRQKAAESMERVLKQGVIRNVEYNVLSMDGHEHPVELSVSVIQNQFGKPVFFVGILKDITERKQAEEALWESEEIFRHFMEYSPFYVFFKDENVRVLRLSNNYETMLGKPVVELLGKNMYEIFPSELAKSMVADDMRIMKEGKTITVEEELNGRFYTTIKFPIHIEGKPRYLAGYSIDITERKKAESLLRENEEKYRALVESLPDVIMRFDQNARHIYVSKSVTKDTGMLPDEYIGKTHREFGIVPEEVCTYWEQAIARVFDTGKTYEKEFVFDGINGPIIYNWRLVPEINEFGNVVSVLGIARDVTEHRKSEKSYQDIFNSMIDGFALNEIICDESGKPIDYRFIDVNPAFEKLTGLSRDLIVGNTVFDVMPGTESYWIDISGKVALTGEPTHFENYSKELGKYFEITVYSPQKGQFATIFSDITDRKQAEVLQEKLQQASKMESIGRLAGGVAHDFNNLLTVIQGNASLGMNVLSKNDPLYDRLDTILEVSVRAAALTRQLLAFSRKQIIEMKVINLNNLINNLSKMLVRLIGEDVDLQIMLSKGLGNINADVGQIEQIIVNLSVNARDAMPNGGKLTIETSNIELDEAYCQTHLNVQPGKYVMLMVSDNGSGMDDATKEHIFEPFFTTKNIGEGTGLGLATVYGIVKQHNGLIEFYSELGHGTTFKIYLPMVEGEVSVQPKEYKKAEMLTGNETILVVEDEDIVREMAVEFLSSIGYNVLPAENGGMALMMAEQHKGTIHLMLTDVVMPNMNGHQLAERLQREHPEIKVLYTSGYTENVIAHHGILDSGLNFIGKPYRLQMLAKKLRDLLDS
jgi:PAS domain S-box-containing protein